MPQNTYDTGDTYDVWQYFINGDAERVRERVNAYEAVKAAKHYTTNVAATKLRITERVRIIANSDDTVAFEWQRDKGVTFV